MLIIIGGHILLLVTSHCIKWRVFSNSETNEMMMQYTKAYYFITRGPESAHLILRHNISLLMLNYVVVNLGLLLKNIEYGPMLHTKQTKHNLPFGIREENLKFFFYNVCPWCSFLVKLPETKCNLLFKLSNA